MIPLSRHLEGKSRRRTLVIVGSIIVVILAVGGYVLWSGSSWSAYHSTNSDWKRDSKSALENALQMPADTTKQRDAKLKALTDAGTILTSDAGSRCQPSGLVGWQTSISTTYKKWQQECEADEAAMSKLNEQLVATNEYLKSEHELAGILSGAMAATNSKVTEKSFSTVLSKWKTASASVKDLKASAQFEPVKVKAQKVVDGATTAWQALVKAHAAKNEADYNAAFKAVATAYSSMDSIETTSTSAFTKQAAELQKVYDAAF